MGPCSIPLYDFNTMNELPFRKSGSSLHSLTSVEKHGSAWAHRAIVDSSTCNWGRVTLDC